MSERKRLVIGERLVHKDTPKGPTAARLAWAGALHASVQVAQREADNGVVWVLDIYEPRGMRAYRADELLEHYERP